MELLCSRCCNAEAVICYANKSLKENTGIILTTSYSPLVYVVEKDQRATADQQLETALLLGAVKEVGRLRVSVSGRFSAAVLLSADCWAPGAAWNPQTRSCGVVALRVVLSRHGGELKALFQSSWLCGDELCDMYSPWAVPGSQTVALVLKTRLWFPKAWLCPSSVTNAQPNPSSAASSSSGPFLSGVFPPSLIFAHTRVCPIASPALRWWDDGASSGPVSVGTAINLIKRNTLYCRRKDPSLE